MTILALSERRKGVDACWPRVSTNILISQIVWSLFQISCMSEKPGLLFHRWLHNPFMFKEKVCEEM